MIILYKGNFLMLCSSGNWRLERKRFMMLLEMEGRDCGAEDSG